jgi:alpha-amylase/alpha-mannosidase (GH57 family)
MNWANFLHFYQPADQQPDILEAVVTQCYRPVLEGFRDQPKVRLTVNINSTLLELFDKYKYHDLLDILRGLGQEGRVEFTSSAKYHPVLPFLNEKETIRQIQLNNETSTFFLGKAFQPKGFFPPEMAYKKELAPLIAGLGFEWIILDEIAFSKDSDLKIDYTKLYRIKDTPLKVFFRERRLSNLIMSAIVRSKESLLETLKADLKSDRYVVTAMDGETFGHHRPGLEKALFDIFSSDKFKLVTLSDLAQLYHTVQEVEPVTSTWASSREDIEKNIQFLSWSDPENQIHTLQWKFTALALNDVYAMDTKNLLYEEVRHKMDVALASDHFWWASAKPWWSLEMIEDGAFRLLDTIRSIPYISNDELNKARDYYEEIVITAFNWQRTGKIRSMMREQISRLRIPFKDRTLGAGGTEEAVYHAFTQMIQDLEQAAAKKGEYEKAILWRDALYKLDNKLDIYDTVNAIDLLRTEIPHGEVEATIEKYKAAYNKIRGGQPEQRG